MTNFIGRQADLQSLETIYKKILTKNQGRGVAIYGKRRIGKTKLVKEFTQDKIGAYYLCSKQVISEQLDSASQIILKNFGVVGAESLNFKTWISFFDYLGNYLRANPTPRVIIFDEFPYLVGTDKSVSSLFQYLWDEQLQDTQTMLILMGSSINMMYKYVLDHSSPLFNRMQERVHLEPLTYYESIKFFDSRLDFEDKFKLYSVVGGFPGYLQELDNSISFEQNLIQNILQKNATLKVDPEFIMTEDFPDPGKYLSILKAIGLRRSKYSEILNASAVDNNQLTFYLNNLLDIKMITREVPITEANPSASKKGSYKITDNLFKFYFSYILPNLSNIENDSIEDIIKDDASIINEFVSKVYEDTTKEFIKQATTSNLLPKFYQFGRWWDKDSEIDLVGLNKIDNSILFVETKWTNKLVDERVYWELVKYSNNVKWGDEQTTKYYALVSKSGFTTEMELVAAQKNVLLISGDGVINSP